MLIEVLEELSPRSFEDHAAAARFEERPEGVRGLIRIERWANSPDHESSKKKPGILNKWVLTVDKTSKDC